MDTEVIKALKQKEKQLQKELDEQLKDLPLYRQLQSLKETIGLFGTEDHKQSTTIKTNVTLGYDKNFKWEEKIVFALNTLGGQGFSSDIIGVLKGHESLSEEKLSKRVIVTVSKLLSEDRVLKIIDKDGRKNKVGLK